MRPEILFPIFAPVTKLAGVGPRIAKLIEKLAGPHISDLLWHLPSGIIDRRYAPKIVEARAGVIATMQVTVDQHIPPKSRRLPYRIICSDETGSLTLVFFHARADYLLKILPEGEERVISGTIEAYGDGVQMPHPDHVVEIKDRASIEAVEPVYPLTQGLSLKVLSKAIKGALDLAPELAEWLDGPYLKKQKWPSWNTALAQVHKPEDETDLEPETLVRQRLAYDELLANQLALALVRVHMRRQAGRTIVGTGALQDKVITALPFELTNSQKEAVHDITKDMSSDGRMHRLLQGDVGSGKTVVALLAMLHAVESGAQAAILAPTEILARQHLATIEPLAEAAGVKVALLTGRDKGKTRAPILEGYASGDIQIAIGTHAIFQEGVEFNDLALAVIDEQHRFGVHQRLALTSKGRAVDVLVMTATPIPRTLTLTAYGDMEVSRLTEKPAGRLPIDTRTVAIDRLDDVVQGVTRALKEGTKIYWVCPLVEESEKLDLAAAEDRFAHLQAVFGDRVGLVHGKMKGKEKDAVMEAFSEGGVDILVATTVIEVGVDVPAATIMIIEHAERFGLAQLHQLRGRIGRGSEKSTCILMYPQRLTETARKRLEIMKDTEDGFIIAEEDLRLRGAGEVLGTRQSGLPEFRLADLAIHGDLIATARDDAKLILEMDPELESERGQHLRVLLYLFERDAAVKFLRSG
ncbi:MAG: ATP-dependent DNA helicase RecG [Rhodospirillaceae bacterium]|nr:ATP-dependent DNA helicase RecG [Rhodospirillaceae bacterium]MBT5941773.1 ATP-dependent DNA helicase RecG [Rhodospirillaceae bacterium]MBT7269088.1 ATP-dependent DNA helicase RecG [Rhodospirillaceae bacterium]